MEHPGGGLVRSAIAGQAREDADGKLNRPAYGPERWCGCHQCAQGAVGARLPPGLESVHDCGYGGDYHFHVVAGGDFLVCSDVVWWDLSRPAVSVEVDHAAH